MPQIFGKCPQIQMPAPAPTYIDFRVICDPLDAIVHYLFANNLGAI